MILSSPLNVELLDKEKKKIVCVAGEPSGDLLFSGVLSELKKSSDSLQLYGIGGPAMISQGFFSYWNIEKLSVRGYVELLKHLPTILKIRYQLLKFLYQHPPDLFLGIDLPDFNLGIAGCLKARGVLTTHFISPSIWAWRKERILKIQHSIDHMFCLFPFETELYKNTSVQAHYVGHPMASSIPLKPNPIKARKSLGISIQPVIAILPGSRLSEIQLIGPGFIKSITHMVKQYNRSLTIIIPVATSILKPLILSMIKKFVPENSYLNILILDGQSSLALEAADVVLIASGTATLEAALWKKPMIISYTVPRLTAWMMRRKGYLPYIGLPNILAKEYLVPEILQEEAKPEILAKAVLSLLDQHSRLHYLEERFSAIHEELSLPTNQKVAEIIKNFF